MDFDFSPLITMLLATFPGFEFPPQAKLTNNTYFDYIIVGGGTAGCVVARRLVEQNCSVLVLEAGGLPNGIALAPLGFPFLPKTSRDYDYESTYNPYAASAQGNKTRLTAGKCLGGSSCLNHLVHVRANCKDYDIWAEVTGNDTWKCENLLHYFKKSEDMKDSEIAEKYSYYHGTNGPVGISRLFSESEEVNTFLKALTESGNSIVEDINSGNNTGYTQPQYTIARDHTNKTGGIRQTTSYSYFYDIKDWPNLHVSTETTVKKIIFEDKTAVGIEADYNGETYIFKANKEVILSAGTFNSPQILQLSGVGPKEHLESFGIENIADLPVGDNLRIAPTAIIVTKTKKHYTLFPINLAGLLPALNPTKLPFPVIYGAGAKNKSSNVPDYISFNLVLSYGTPFALLACTSVYGYNLDICLDWQKHLTLNDGIMSVLVNLEAESTGTVRLNSTKASDAPLITTGFYDKPEDLDRFAENALDFISFVKSPSMVELGAEVVGLDLIECAEYETGSKEFWKCYLRQRTITAFLYSSTCAMGSVVDGNLKVIGLKNIRVVDGSVIPNLMHGAFNAAVIALAEKSADQIIAENGGCQKEDTA